MFQGDITWVFVPTARETKWVIEEGKNKVTNGLHYRKISRCEELERKISQIWVHFPEWSNAFSGSNSRLGGCACDGKGCLAQVQRSSHSGTSATEKVDPKHSQPQSDFFGPELHSTLVWEWCQADLSLEHTNPLTDFILQSEYYPAENIPSAQH